VLQIEKASIYSSDNADIKAICLSHLLKVLLRFHHCQKLYQIEGSEQFQKDLEKYLKVLGLVSLGFY